MTEKSRKGIGGRPTKYSRELADRICSLISQGNSLVRVCKEVGLTTETVYSWLRTNQEFSDIYARSRGDQADYHFDLAWEIANEPCPEHMTPSEHAQDKRVRIDTIKWRAGKMKPNVYGERQHVEHSGRIEHSIDSILEDLDGKTAGIVRVKDK